MRRHSWNHCVQGLRRALGFCRCSTEYRLGIADEFPYLKRNDIYPITPTSPSSGGNVNKGTVPPIIEGLVTLFWYQNRKRPTNYALKGDGGRRPHTRPHTVRPSPFALTIVRRFDALGGSAIEKTATTTQAIVARINSDKRSSSSAF